MSEKKDLKLVTQPQDYFRELVTAAMGRQQVTAQPETEFYLVNLLNEFMTADRLTEEPLALMVKEALEKPEPHEKRTIFRQVGDVSLYMAGYFQDSLNRKLVDVDYYIGMGGTAYQQVATLAESSVRGVFEELANRFGTFVDVLADVSEKTSTPRNEKDILRLYELWVTTKSERAAKALQEAGIVPNELIKKDWQ